MARKKQLIIPIFLPFGGCPHRCVFCDQEKITGRSTMPEIGGVEETIERYLSTWNAGNDGNGGKGAGRKEVAFYGGSFTGLKEDVQEGYLKAAHRFVLNGEIDALRISTRPDYIGRDSLEFLKRYNVEIIELGVQSLSDDVLRLSGRGHDSTDTVRAVTAIKNVDLKVGFQLMPGLPGDTREKIIETAEKTVQLRPDFVRIYPTLVIRDTPLYRMYLEGRYAPWALSDMVEVLKEVFAGFKEASIPVIRVGLHHSKEMSDNIVAGPYHPSLRDMLSARPIPR